MIKNLIESETENCPETHIWAALLAYARVCADAQEYAQFKLEDLQDVLGYPEHPLIKDVSAIVLLASFGYWVWLATP